VLELLELLAIGVVFSIFRLMFGFFLRELEASLALFFLSRKEHFT